MYSSKVDTIAFDKFFEKIKNVESFSPNVFMSDDYPGFFNAWNTVMEAETCPYLYLAHFVILVKAPQFNKK